MPEEADQFAAVLAGAAAGDPSMLGELWRRHQPRLLAYLRACDHLAAEDLASDTWLSVAGSLARFEGDEDAFRRWLFTAARRRVVDLRRRQARRPTDLRGEPPTVAAPRSDPAEHAADSEAASEAVELIRTLPPDQAEVVLLRVIADLDVATVAAIVGRSPGAVRVQCHRGLRRLAEHLGGSSVRDLDGSPGTSSANRVTDAPPPAMF